MWPSISISGTHLSISKDNMYTFQVHLTVITNSEPEGIGSSELNCTGCTHAVTLKMKPKPKDEHYPSDAKQCDCEELRPVVLCCMCMTQNTHAYHFWRLFDIKAQELFMA